MTNKKIRAGIVGAAGYAGAELFRLLRKHPDVSIEFATDLKFQGPIGDIYPELRPLGDMEITEPETGFGREVDVAFLCLPHTVSMDTAARYLDEGVKVIDLSADFRHADPDDYRTWYDVEHRHPELCREAVYGMPELFRDQIKGARLVGNPGCYPTGACLGLAPLVAEKIISTRGIVIDSKSGVSGAGRNPIPRTHFVETSDSIAPYNPGRGHRHVGEIDEVLGRMAGVEVKVTFTPHLTPMNRGILTAAYADFNGDADHGAVIDIYRSAYGDEPFVQVMSDGLPETKFVRGTNNCYIGVKIVPESGKLIAFTAIDNLIKGASGTAVQNMNLIFEIDERLGLI
ncbi:N-acetyl-gamma-glutamyl-phosphate reductase [candidate division KSB1 bacterium]